MEERPERLADYFVVVGIGEKNVTKFKQFEEEVNLPEKSALLEPVTDIAIFYSKHEQDKIKGYKIIDSTPAGYSADVGSLLPNRTIYICYKKGRDKPPITDIGVFHSNQNHSPPAGYETLVFSIGGRSGDLNTSGRSHIYLTFKRGLIQGHNNAITDLCLIASSKGEEPPPCYKVLKPLDLSKGVVSHTLHLCYRTCQVRPPNTAYTPELLSRYPEKDDPEFPLPVSVPLFCLPFGVSVEHWGRHTPFPYPTFSTFALTNAQGQCMYGAVVVFYETVGSHPCLKEMSKALNVHEEEPLHMNKCICLLSHWPFFSAFKAFLCALYRLSLSRDATLPLERYVGNLMLEVPFPSLVRPRIQMHIGSESIVFSLPVKTPLPLSVSTHWSLLTSLDQDNCTTLFLLALLEQKIVLHSSRPALLTCVGEALRSILFPFSWQCTYIPLCPLAFSSYMQAPVPFIIGIDSQYFDVFDKPSGVVVVDLDANAIIMSKEMQEMMGRHPPPSKAIKTLKQSLQQLVPKVAGMDSGLDLAVEVAPIDYNHTYKYDMEVLDVEIREVFLRFMATILGHYRSCLTPLLSAPSDRSCEASHLFNQKLFLKSCSSSESPFFNHFFDTQIFNAFIEQRSFAHVEDTRFVFFDECTEKVKTQPSSKLVDASARISRLADLPTVVSLPVDDYGLPQGKTYNYSVFPTTLDHTLFTPATPPSADPHNRLSIPAVASASHLASTTSSPMVARRTNAEKDRDKKLMEKAVKSEQLWSKYLLSQVCSLWYMLLPSLLHHHWNKMGTLVEAMDLLEDMRLNKTLPNDEVCYRVLMEQCVHLKRPALAVRVYHEMIKAGIQPNAITYGFYNKAVLEGAWPSQRRRWKVLLIVVSVCVFLRKVVASGNSSKSSRVGRPQLGKILGEADFSSIALGHQSMGKNNISALDVGLDERRDLAEGEEGGDDGTYDYHSLRRKRRGRVYKLTSPGDYAVCGDSSYVATSKLPRWNNEARGQEVGGAQGGGHIQSMLSNVVGQSPGITRGATPSLVGGINPSLEIEMTSCSQCPSCERLLYDEQIMSGWTGDDGNYKTTCPFCDKQMVASLTIISRTTFPPSTHATPTRAAPQTSPSSSHSSVSSSSLLVDQDVCDYSDKTWPRKLSRSKHEGGNPEGVARTGQTVKTDGLPTHSEDSFVEDLRGVEEGVAGRRSTPKTDPLHRKSPTTMFRDDETDGVVAADSVTPLSASQSFRSSFNTSLDESSTSLLNDPKGRHRIGSAVTSADFIAIGNHVNVRVPSPGNSKVGVADVPKITIGQKSVDDGSRLEENGSARTEVGRLLVQMKRLGHRRSSSAPIKRQPRQGLSMPSGLLGSQGNCNQEPVRPRNCLEPCGMKSTSPPTVVPYLSPIVLRKEVELLLLQDGSKYLEREELVRERPIIYWNLVWYLSRLQLPTFLPLLSLWDFQHKNKDLKKLSLHMTVTLLWDQAIPGIRSPLYLIWQGKRRGSSELSQLVQDKFKRRDSESQLQSLVARIQCGDWSPVISSLLKDRMEEGGGSGEERPLSPEELLEKNILPRPRSIYREILFLKMAVSSRTIITTFDREFLQCLQRLPKEKSARLHQEDFPPSARAVQCRQDFGPLQIIRQ